MNEHRQPPQGELGLEEEDLARQRKLDLDHSVSGCLNKA